MTAMDEAPLPSATRRKENLYIDVYPESWYAVAPSSSLKPGQIEPLEAFGEKWVLYRTASGVVQISGRFCPHYGASFQTGKVNGERIVCPFHGWEYEHGVCVRIPYMEGGKIPPAARVDTLPVKEHLGWIWVWHGRSPTFDLPDLPESHDRKYARLEKSQWLDVHPLTVLENGTDVQHFKYVHRSNFERYELEMKRDEEHHFAFDLKQWYPVPFKRMFSVDTSIHYIGGTVIFGTVGANGKQHSAFIASPLPVSFGRTHFHLIVFVKKLPLPFFAVSPIYERWIADRIFDGSTDDYNPIWRHMDVSRRGALVAEDALQQRFHRFYRSHLPKDAESKIAAAS
jgi:phenylpropionate dioxygenase-like ring-hydroxylating dioxygenase large terminal subunit